MSMSAEGFQPKISALLSRNAAQVGRQGAAAGAGNYGRRGPEPARRSAARFFQVRECSGGVVKSWTEFAPL